MDSIEFAITAPTRRWFPGCAVNACPVDPVYAVILTEGRWGHVHACPAHTRALLMWQRVSATIALLDPRSLWSFWCPECELGRNRFTAWSPRWR